MRFAPRGEAQIGLFCLSLSAVKKNVTPLNTFAI
jgi:hypothetical protein